MTILNNLKLVNKRIKKSCAISGIDLSKVKILAVSKKMGTNKILEAYKAGLNLFGENYISESIEKINHFKKLGLNFEYQQVPLWSKNLYLCRRVQTPYLQNRFLV